VKDEVETSPIPVAIIVYVSRGWQPCLAPREVILRHCEIRLGYPQALPRVPDLTEAAAILFSTLELREIILRHSHAYLTLRRQPPSSLGYLQALPRLPNLTAAAAILFSLSSDTSAFT